MYDPDFFYSLAWSRSNPFHLFPWACRPSEWCKQGWDSWLVTLKLQEFDEIRFKSSAPSGCVKNGKFTDKTAQQIHNSSLSLKWCNSCSRVMIWISSLLFFLPSFSGITFSLDMRYVFVYKSHFRFGLGPHQAADGPFSLEQVKGIWCH